MRGTVLGSASGNLREPHRRPAAVRGRTDTDVSDATPFDDAARHEVARPRGVRYAYLRKDGTVDIVVGSFVAGVGAYAYQFLGGHALGAEAFAPIGALLTAHFLTFVVILLPIEQLVIRRITLGAGGWVVPLRAVLLAVATALVAGGIVWATADAYFDGDVAFVGFVLATVLLHFGFAVGRGHLAGKRRFRAYGLASAGASLLRLVVAVGIVVAGSTVAGFAWAHVLGPLVIVAFRPWRRAARGVEPRRRLRRHEVEAMEDGGLLTSLVLSAAASQVLLLAGPLVAGALGASDVEFSVVYATLLLARAPLTLGYNLIARILPPFTEMAARGERRELRAWARGMGLAGVVLGGVGALLGAGLGPPLVAFAFGGDFRPTAPVAALAAFGVVLAASGLFVGQVLVARGRALRLAASSLVALAAAGAGLLLPLTDPALRVMAAFVLGEGGALAALVWGALMRDEAEGAVSHGYLVAKRTIDIAGSLVALILLAPVILLAALAVRIDSRGPAFFRQARTGRDGREFWMVKLRTMVVDHDEEVFQEHLERLRRGVDGNGDQVYTIRIEDDPRITRVGALLRRWSLDELPNFWNVLKGNMSLVGPRPLVPDEAALVGLSNPRFRVRPGVTGLAQVRGRDTLSLEERTAFDEQYVRERSLSLDLRILAETVATVFRQPGDEDR